MTEQACGASPGEEASSSGEQNPPSSCVILKAAKHEGCNAATETVDSSALLYREYKAGAERQPQALARCKSVLVDENHTFFPFSY